MCFGKLCNKYNFNSIYSKLSMYPPLLSLLWEMECVTVGNSLVQPTYITKLDAINLSVIKRHSL